MIRISNDSVFKNGELVEMKLPKKLIPTLQVLEYERLFLASRILLDKFNYIRSLWTIQKTSCYSSRWLSSKLYG